MSGPDGIPVVLGAFADSLVLGRVSLRQGQGYLIGGEAGNTSSAEKEHMAGLDLAGLVEDGGQCAGDGYGVGAVLGAGLG